MEFGQLAQRARDFVQEHTRLSIAVMAILLFFAISALITAMVQASSPQKKVVEAPYDDTFVATDAFLPPAAPALVEDYYFSRQKNGQWDDEDMERWFTPVDSSMLNDLATANDSLASTITEAAP